MADLVTADLFKTLRKLKIDEQQAILHDLLNQMANTVNVCQRLKTDASPDVVQTLVRVASQIAAKYAVIEELRQL